MNKQISKILLIVSAVVQGLFLLFIYVNRMIYSVESLFTVIFIVIFVIFAFYNKEWFQVFLAAIYFVYAVAMFITRIEFYYDLSLYLFILPSILLGIILLVDTKFHSKSILMLVLCIVQLVILTVGEDLTRKRNIIFVLIDLMYILTLNIPCILILIDSIKMILKQKTKYT